MIFTVELSKGAKKDLTKVPEYIRLKFQYWVSLVEEISIENVRKIKGFHDEPLQGNRFGQRSIRLNKEYRAIYSIMKDKIELVLVEEVNKHEY